MDLVDGMRTFVAAVEAGSFTAAADRLGLSNKLVSKYVGELEVRLGVRLLHRTTRSLSLTEAGQRYHEGCVTLLASLEALEASLSQDDRTLGGTIRIAAPMAFGEVHIQPLLRRFAELHPRIRIDLRLADRFVDLADEGIDLAIRIGTLDGSTLMARRLGTIELWVVTSPAYAAAHGVPASPGDLARHDCVFDSNLRSGQAWHFTSGGKPHGVRVSGRFAVNSARAAADLVLAGAGIGLCPDFVVAPDVRTGRLLRLLPSFEAPSLDIHAVFPSVRQLPAKTRRMLDFLGEEFRRDISGRI